MFEKLIYKIKKPYLFVAEEKSKLALKAAQLLFKDKNVFVLGVGRKNKTFYVKNSKKTVFLLTEEKFTPSQKEILKMLETSDTVIKPLSLKTKIETKARILEYGFEKHADLSASDLSQKEGFTNLKLNHKGNTIPLWLPGKWNKKETKVILGVILASLDFNFNLVKTSQALKGFEKQKK